MLLFPFYDSLVHTFMQESAAKCQGNLFDGSKSVEIAMTLAKSDSYYEKNVNIHSIALRMETPVVTGIHEASSLHAPLRLNGSNCQTRSKAQRAVPPAVTEALPNRPGVFFSVVSETD